MLFTQPERLREDPVFIDTPAIESYTLEKREALADDRRTRGAFGALAAGERRMTVHPDAERGFRVEGRFRVALETENARRSQATDGRPGSVVAGVRFGRVETIVAELPWAA